MIKLGPRDSQNRKLGSGVRATYREVGPTCPRDCKHLKDKSCYALYGFVNIHSRKSPFAQDDSERLHDWLEGLPENKKVRHHVSGDFMDPSGQVDNKYLKSMVESHRRRPDLQGWVYTHAWKEIDPKYINSTQSLTANASCDSVDDLKQAHKMGWPTTTVVSEKSSSQVIDLDGDTLRIVVCPNQTHGVSCAECMLCFRKNRKCAVGFRVHGTGKSKFSQ